MFLRKHVMCLLIRCHIYPILRNLACNSLLRKWPLQNVGIAVILDRKLKMPYFKIGFPTVSLLHIIQRI